MLSSDEYKAIFDASPDGCIVVGSDGVIRGANPRVEAIFGWSAGELVGQSIEVLIPETVRETHSGHRGRFAANPHNRPMGAGLDLRGQRRDGTTFPVEVSLSPWRRDEGDLSVICSVRDVTHYRRLQNFSEGALRATEEERQRIARELHDDTAQRLATLILRVRMLTDQDDPVARRELFETVRGEIVEAAEGVKRMSRGLRPPEIEEVGLPLAVQAHVRSLKEIGDLEVVTKLGFVDSYLDITSKLVLYRIIQEALSNARRHARARRAKVTLRYEDGEVVAEVQDDGRGFTLDSVSDGQGGGLGLVGMQERAAMVGGRLVIEAVPGDGTRVRVSVPVKNTESVDG